MRASSRSTPRRPATRCSIRGNKTRAAPIGAAYRPAGLNPPSRLRDLGGCATTAARTVASAEGSKLSDEWPDGVAAKNAAKPDAAASAAPAGAWPAAKPAPESAPRPAGTITRAAPAAEEPSAQPAWYHDRRVAVGGGAVLAVLLLAILGGPRLAGLFTLPECNDEGPRKALAAYFAQNNVKLTRLGDVKALSSTRSERTCSVRADAQGRVIYLDYRIGWSGWDESCTITRAETESRIEQELMDDVRAAAKDFLELAKDSTISGKPPRYTEPTVATLLDRIFDLSEIEGATLAAADIARANVWFAAGDRVGTVYILAGTGVGDINRLPNDPNVQRRTHRNVSEFATEFARYLDFQVKLAGMMMDAELKRTAKAGPDMERPEVMREIADVRTTLAETLTGDLTTLAYDGLPDEWRRARLATMMRVVPKAATFLTPDQARAVRDRALTVMTFVRDKSVQDQVKALADAFAVK